MTLLQKKTAALIMFVSMVVMAGCNNLGGGDSAVLGDVLTERNVLRALYAEPDLTGDPITVSCVGGAVTLSGLVDDSLDIALAERVARSIDGVTSVNNNLKQSN